MTCVRAGENVSRAEWERIFGSEEARRKKILRDRKGHLLDGAKKLNDTVRVAAVHGDEPWGCKGVYYPCLGEVVYSRTDEREKFKRAGIVHRD